MYLAFYFSENKIRILLLSVKFLDTVMGWLKTLGDWLENFLWAIIIDRYQKDTKRYEGWQKKLIKLYWRDFVHALIYFNQEISILSYPLNYMLVHVTSYTEGTNGLFTFASTPRLFENLKKRETRDI